MAHFDISRPPFDVMHNAVTNSRFPMLASDARFGSASHGISGHNHFPGLGLLEYLVT